MSTKIETPVERAEKLLPQIDRIFLGSLFGKEARAVIREGRSVLRELVQLKNGEASINLLIESLKLSIQMAREEVENEKPK
ncbi:MAG: hypothetical protein Q7K44_00625 [Candidatus Liptonbacteria bacterium]|nr:hypothetical protein [Candidatus Liptonbacteria bacterium]